MSSLDRSVLTLAAIMVTFLVGMLVGKESLVPRKEFESAKVKKSVQQVRVVNLEERSGKSGLAAIGSVIVGALALVFAYRKTVIAEKSRIDPLVQTQHKLEAEMVMDLLSQMRKCLSSAEAYSEMAQVHLTPGESKPAHGGAKVTEYQEKLLRARQILNKVELESQPILSKELANIVNDFREGVSSMYRNEFEVSKRGDEMVEDLYDTYFRFLEHSRSSLGTEEINERSVLD